eukprot:m.87626 g.87626  ORF g.87626 m.87626 type:complete len:232 (-) comp8791_c1_seq1:218-913(-)
MGDKLNTTLELDTIEGIIRTEEEAVLAELGSDRHQTEKYDDLLRKTTKIFKMYDAGETLVGVYGGKLQQIQNQEDRFKKEAWIYMKELNKISNSINRMQPIRSQIEHELLISRELSENLVRMGEERDHGIMHALKGLANTKARKAEGVRPPMEVFDKLRLVTSETQSLSVSHTNLRVRLAHSLRIVARLLRSLEPMQDIVNLEQKIQSFLATVPLSQTQLTYDSTHSSTSK